MNNHHLFLIRSDSVTQLAAHLTAGIVALALVSSVFAPKHKFRPDSAARSPAVERPALPAGTTVLAISEPGLR